MPKILDRLVSQLQAKGMDKKKPLLWLPRLCRKRET